jgi:hypothetical protein
MGKADTLKVKGKTGVYRATRGGGERHFCPRCASALWVWDRHWPQWVYPFASAIDTPLPRPKERQLIFMDSRASWADVPPGRRFKAYPKEAIADWHRKRGLLRP